MDPVALENGRKSAHPCDKTHSSSVESGVPRNLIVLHSANTICMMKIQNHIYPVAVFRSPRETRLKLLRCLLYGGVSDSKTSVLLLEGILVVKEDVAIKIMMASDLL